MNNPKETYPRWVGTLMSLLVPGAGIFCAGRRRSGILWFVGIEALGAGWWTASPQPAVPALWVFGAGLILGLAVWVAMLVMSWQPVRRIGFQGWLALGIVCAIDSWGIHRLESAFTGVLAMSSGSMAPAIRGPERLPNGDEAGGDRLLIQKTAYWYDPPSRGDIVVFRSDGLHWTIPNTHYLKRVVGLPGERIRFRDGQLEVNGAVVTQPPVLTRLRFLPPPRAGGLRGVEEDFTVPAGQYFVVGDNATNSYDSRSFGPVPAPSIVGRVTKIFWPLAHAGDVE